MSKDYSQADVSVTFDIDFGIRSNLRVDSEDLLRFESYLLVRVAGKEFVVVKAPEAIWKIFEKVDEDDYRDVHTDLHHSLAVIKGYFISGDYANLALWERADDREA